MKKISSLILATTMLLAIPIQTSLSEKNETMLGVMPLQVSTSSQFARPDGDISNFGYDDSNSDGLLYNDINEVVPDGDLTRVESRFNPGMAGKVDTFEVSLSDVADPQTSSGHIIKYWARSSDDNCQRNIIFHVELYQGSTLIASTPDIFLGAQESAWSKPEYTLTALEADSIADYTNLSLKFVPFTSNLVPPNLGQHPPCRALVSWAEVEVPTPSLP